MIAVIIKVSPRPTADLIKVDSRHSYVTKILQVLDKDLKNVLTFQILAKEVPPG